MAIYFDSTSYIYTKTAPGTGADKPFSIVAYVNTDTSIPSAYRTLVYIGEKNYVRYFALRLLNTRPRIESYTSIANLNGNGDISLNTWNILVCSFVSDTERNIWSNVGAKKSQAATSYGPTVAERYGVGSSIYGAETYRLVGALSDVVVWKGYALTDQDADALIAGCNPLTIGRQYIVSYMKLNGDGLSLGSPRARDTLGDYHMTTIKGSPYKVEKSTKMRSYFMAGCG